MIYRILHRTVYDYSEPVTVSHHAARLQPRLTDVQPRVEFSLEIAPAPAVRTPHTDYFGNQICFFSVQQIHRRLEITAASRVWVNRVTPPAPGLSPAWQKVAALFRQKAAGETAGLHQFRFDSPLLRATPELAAYARASFGADTPLLAGAQDLNRRVFSDFKYDPVATTAATPLAEVWRSRRGVCQDFAHLAIACLRSLGLPARYVSGYLRTHPAPGQAPRTGADASHAWFSVFCPGVGWVDFDPTNNLLPSDEHITVACGRDFSDVSPVSGILVGGGSHAIQVAVDVREGEEGPA
ncbi:MAG TPA: transglutaminase family protein [Candidatus Acidoferrum sp.]|nr:transglutaminase family protein [Candidatus Acidoferrum sp.]